MRLIANRRQLNALQGRKHKRMLARRKPYSYPRWTAVMRRYAQSGRLKIVSHDLLHEMTGYRRETDARSQTRSGDLVDAIRYSIGIASPRSPIFGI